MNPYLEEVAGRPLYRFGNGNELDSWATGWPKREEYTLKYSWSIPDDRTVAAIANWGPIVEIGAGSGYWASLIAEAGAEVEAYDLDPPGSWVRRDSEWHRLPDLPFDGIRHQQPRERPPWHAEQSAWFPVKPGQAVEVAAGAAHATLMLSWPPCGHLWPSEAIRAYYGAGGRRVVYIGEQSGGCCGNADLFDLLGLPCYDHYEEPEGSCPLPLFELVQEMTPKLQWTGIRDYVTFHERA